MWNYEKRLEYPVNIKTCNPQLAQVIISQLGGPDGETGAAVRYLSQRYAMPYDKVCGVLTDIGVSVGKLRMWIVLGDGVLEGVISLENYFLKYSKYHYIALI